MEIEEAIETLKKLKTGIEILNILAPKENKDKKDIEAIDTILSYIDKLKADKNKLINYIAIRENKTHEEVCKEFEVGE